MGRDPIRKGSLSAALFFAYRQAGAAAANTCRSMLFTTCTPFSV
jgi:hypothetical protein